MYIAYRNYYIKQDIVGLTIERGQDGRQKGSVTRDSRHSCTLHPHHVLSAGVSLEFFNVAIMQSAIVCGDRASIVLQ